ncbi:MAG: hypothetical protein QXI60_05325 [Thermofilaceae archaeon]
MDLWQKMIEEYLARQKEAQAAEGAESAPEEAKAKPEEAPKEKAEAPPVQAPSAQAQPPAVELPGGARLDPVLLSYLNSMRMTAYNDYVQSELSELGISWETIENLVAKEMTSRYNYYAQRPFGYVDAYHAVKTEILKEASARPELFAALNRRGVPVEERTANPEDEARKRYVDELRKVMSVWDTLKEERGG